MEQPHSAIRIPAFSTTSRNWCLRRQGFNRNTPTAPQIRDLLFYKCGNQTCFTRRATPTGRRILWTIGHRLFPCSGSGAIRPQVSQRGRHNFRGRQLVCRSRLAQTHIAHRRLRLARALLLPNGRRPLSLFACFRKTKDSYTRICRR